MKIYGKENVIRLLSAMSGAKRFPHTIIFTGEAGVGKNTAAKYAAMLMMCENVKTEGGLSSPCGECRACRRIENRAHPDIIYPAVSGKSQIYSRETMRSIVPDSYVKPNDADIKIYIFEHFEDTEAASQNVLLKVIEDPPEGVRFIFTANKKSAFLPTILSRAVVISVPETTAEVTAKALRDTNKYDEAAIKLAAESFPGNIGQSVIFLEGGKTAEQRKICIKVIDAVINADEYALLAALSKAGENRSEAREIITMAIKVIRDATVLIAKEDAPLIGCYKEGAKQLAAGLTKRRAADIYDKFSKTAFDLSTNVNIALTFSALASKLHT
jgi:DNA polymerase III gamma/tau subunit